MTRWRPDPSGRLVSAALELFEEHGYEDASVVGIAERAGLTKSTFFRHFPDKREVLFRDVPLTRALSEGLAAAPPEASPLAAVAHALNAIGRNYFTLDHRRFSRRRRAVIAESSELREREALKRADLTATMMEGLRLRGTPEAHALVAARIGALVWEIALDRWIDAEHDQEFGLLALEVLAEVRAVVDAH